MDNQILTSPIKFQLRSLDGLNAPTVSFGSISYIDVQINDTLIPIKAIPFIGKVRAEMINIIDCALFIAIAYGVGSKPTIDVRVKAKQDFDTRKKVDGYSILHLQSMKLLWISTYDLSYLKAWHFPTHIDVLKTTGV